VSVCVDAGRRALTWHPSPPPSFSQASCMRFPLPTSHFPRRPAFSPSLSHRRQSCRSDPPAERRGAARRDAAVSRSSTPLSPLVRHSTARRFPLLAPLRSTHSVLRQQPKRAECRAVAPAALQSVTRAPSWSLVCRVSLCRSCRYVVVVTHNAAASRLLSFFVPSNVWSNVYAVLRAESVFFFSVNN